MGSAGTLEPPGWETAPAPVACTPNKNPQSRWVSPLALAAGPPGAETGRLRAGDLRRDPGLSRSSAAVLTGRPGKPGSRLPHLWSGTFPPEALSRRLSPVQGELGRHCRLGRAGPPGVAVPTMGAGESPPASGRRGPSMRGRRHSTVPGAPQWPAPCPGPCQPPEPSPMPVCCSRTPPELLPQAGGAERL